MSSSVATNTSFLYYLTIIRNHSALLEFVTLNRVRVNALYNIISIDIIKITIALADNKKADKLLQAHNSMSSQPPQQSHSPICYHLRPRKLFCTSAIHVAYRLESSSFDLE